MLYSIWPGHDLIFLYIQFMKFSNSYMPTILLMLVVKCIFRYLQDTLDLGLFLHPSTNASIIVAYFDVDWMAVVHLPFDY